MITDPEQLFDAATLRNYETAGLLARRLVRGRLRAERRSFTRGMSVEFAEYRPFVSGDDWRAIDWNAYARWRQLVLKLFVEEEDLHVHLMLDCSASMDWGTPSKFDQARRILAGLGYLSLANLDRAAFVPLGVAPGFRLAPRRGRGRFPELLAAIAACPAEGGATSLDEATRLWLRTSPRKGLVVLVGDLFGNSLGDARSAMDRIRHAGHEIGVIQILSPDEIEPPAPGEYELEDCETGMVRQVALDPVKAGQFRQRVKAFLDGFDTYTKKHAVSFLRVTNDKSVSDVLTSVLAWR
jgi:uncharacterized protein (DUF58 family)